MIFGAKYSFHLECINRNDLREINITFIMSRVQFTEALNSLVKDPSSEVFSPTDIACKISCLLAPKPSEPKKEIIRWQRVHDKFMINTYRGTQILYLRGKGEKPARRVLSTDDLFDTLERLHKFEADHTGRTRLYKRASQEFYGVTEKICGIFVKTCSVCYLKKSKKSLKSVVVKPIVSSNFHCRGQVDLIDMSDMNLQANLSSDGVTPYKYLLVYSDHFTKKINLSPLKRKCAEEVADVLLNIFCDAGPPHILHSDNGREFKNELLFSTLTERWPTQKIVYGKPRHPESQGAVERANCDIKDALFTIMHDNSNDECWVKYLRWVQLHKNISYHTTIKMTPYEAVYNKKPSFGLTHFGIPHEHWNQIDTEEDLNDYQNECQDNVVDIVEDSISFHTSGSENEQCLSPPSKFLLLNDQYHDEISQPPPLGTIVSEHLPPSSSSIFQEHLPPSSSSIFQEHLPPSSSSIFQEHLPPSSSATFPENLPPSSAFGLDPGMSSAVSTTSKNCVACGKLTSGAHSCPRCHHYIHSICGRAEGAEGYGNSVVCPACDLAERRIPFDSMRAGIKRNQEKLHERMLNTSSKKLRPAEVGDIVVIPIAQPDKVNSLGPRNMLGCITEKGETTYRVGTSQGTLSVGYTRNQFELCSTNLLARDSVPDVTITQTQAMQSELLGISSGSACRCRHCKTLRCPCKKASRNCNSKCHRGNTCFNRHSFT